MKKEIKIEPHILPMPVVIVGTNVNNHPTFMTASFTGIMNYNPLVIYVSLGNGHYTNQGIETNQTFSINIPPIELIVKTDYIGLVSSKKESKEDVFDWFYGKLKTAPLVLQAAINIECKLLQKIEFSKDTAYIGEVQHVYSDEKYLTDNQVDMQKIKPFLFTMPDNKYWSLGEHVGDAWKIGKIYSNQKMNEKS